MLMNTRDARPGALLGLLQPSEPVRPPGQPTSQIIRGHWDVLDYVTLSFGPAGVVDLSRSLSAPDSANVLLPFDGIHACEICREEHQTATYKSERLLAWLNMHRATLDPKACLEFPDDGGLYKGPNDAHYQRTRRFILLNSGEKRLNQSTVCAPSAVIQSVSTLITYA